MTAELRLSHMQLIQNEISLISLEISKEEFCPLSLFLTDPSAHILAIEESRLKNVDKLNPYKHSALFLGPRQTVQTQIRRRRTDQGLHSLLTGISIRK